MLRRGSCSPAQWSGHRIWPAAAALLEHLQRTRGQSLRGLRIVELGCGLPLVGAALAAFGAEVCATDHPSMLAHVEAALGLMEGLLPAARSRLRLRALPWGEAEAANVAELCGFTQVDLLVGADLVYHSFPLQPLRDTIVRALRDNFAMAVLALQARRFPMVAALEEPQRVARFLKGLAMDGTGFEVTADRPSGSSGADSQGLVLASIAPPGARARARAPIATATGQLGWRPLRYRRQAMMPLPAD